MRKVLYILAVILFCLSFAGCSGCSKHDTSWITYSEEDYSIADGNDTDSVQEPDGNAMKTPIEVEIPEGVMLVEIGKKAYSGLLDWEERYNLGGVKLCAEMSADKQGKWVSSFTGNTTISFYPPSSLHLHKISVTDNSSNIICRIINGEIDVSLGNVQNDLYRTNSEQPAFIVNITTNNLTADSIPIVIPIGQMLEAQSPDVQNIMVCHTYSDILNPFESETFIVRAFCGSEKRENPSFHSVKLTPFVLKAPSYAYITQTNLWNFQRTDPATDNSYTITFYAWGIGNRIENNENLRKSLTGHAFVDIPDIGIVGFGINGITDHTNYVQYADYQCSIKINESALKKVHDKYWKWKNNPPAYSLAEYDCTTFAMDIADAAGIYYGPRWAVQFPAGFMRQLNAMSYLNKTSIRFLNELRTYNE